MTIQFTSVDQALRKTLTKKGAIGEAQAAYRWVLESFPNNKRAMEGLQTLGGASTGEANAPTREQVNALITLHQQRQFGAALKQALALAVVHPKVAFLRNFAGACQYALGA